MTDESDPIAAPIPKERDCRFVEDADARGLPIVLHGGETWYVQPLPLSSRGLKIAKHMDAIGEAEIDAAAEKRRVEILTKALDEASPEEIDARRDVLKAAVRRRTEVQERLAEAYREVAYHALRSLYRVTIEQTSVLVTQRHFGDLLAALNGRNTSQLEADLAIALFERLQKAAGKGNDGSGPLPSPSPSGGPAGSATPTGSTRTG